jgi:hypothetical protein
MPLVLYVARTTHSNNGWGHPAAAIGFAVGIVIVFLVMFFLVRFVWLRRKTRTAAVSQTPAAQATTSGGETPTQVDQSGPPAD